MKTKIQIKSIIGHLLFEFETENNTLIKTVTEAIKNKADLSYADFNRANFSGANFSYADFNRANFSGANFSGADFSGADFSGANFSGANFSGANLRYADFKYANLRGANTTKRYIQISCIGRAKRLTTYCFEDDIIWCGCFEGSLEEFKLQVEKTHANNDQYLKEYLGFINYIESLK